MMFSSTPKAIFRIVREDDETFTLTREWKGQARDVIGHFQTKQAAVAAAEATAAMA